jgi:hypothetical protein
VLGIYDDKGFVFGPLILQKKYSWKTMKDHLDELARTTPGKETW